MQEKIDKINKLNRSMNQAKEFLNLLEESNKPSRYSEQPGHKINELYKIEISSHIWTGSDNPAYSSVINDKYILNKIPDIIKPFLLNRIEEIESEIKLLLNES